tara:strand:- start:80862 stop:81998 length:1137 start_codon:yes stop_codon:yes gene_type:complete
MFQGGETHNLTKGYVNSLGELFILQFSAMCFLVTNFISQIHRDRIIKFGQSIKIELAPNIWKIAIALTILFTCAYAGTRLPSTQHLFSNLIGQEFHHALTPSLSISLVFLAFSALNQPTRIQAILFTVFAACLGTMVAIDLAATPTLIALSGVLLFFVLRRYAFKRFAAMALVSIAIAVSAVAISAIKGRPIHVDQTKFPIVEYGLAKLTSKFVLRQGVSGFCLNNIIVHDLGPKDQSPLYFLSAIVPRFIWPEKPILSLGSQFAESYCHQGQAYRLKHSESITLLGEPLIRSSIFGLLTAQLAVFLICYMVAFGGLSGNVINLLVLTALLPWLIPFEQHFAQYIGNIFKSALVILPFAGVLYLCRFHIWSQRDHRSL